MDDALEAIKTDFLAAGIPTDRTPDLKTARWKKLVWNIPYNGLSVVLNAGTDEIMGDAGTAALSRKLMLEVIRGAQACGGNVETVYADWICDFTRNMKPYKTSMILDYEAKRPMETEYIYRRPLEAARAAGVELPLIDMLATQLEFLDARNRRVP
jgi:2-dehydropantoate 2-reductase